MIGSRIQPIWEADALTVNPYLGRDAVEPFLQSARKAKAGVFVLVRTSNPGAGQFQDLRVAAGSEPARPLYEHVGQAVASWARENLGKCGFGDVGAVVGATYPAELTQLRALLPEVLFLVPGFGAQGGSAADVLPAFRPDGLGALVNSSRGITFPYTPDDRDWESKVEAATKATIAAIAPRGERLTMTSRRRVLRMLPFSLASLVVCVIALWMLYPFIQAQVSFTGIVTANGQPVAGARVRAQALESFAITDDKGRFHLTLTIPTRTGRLTAWKDGYFVAGTRLNGWWPVENSISLSPLPDHDAEDYDWVDPAPQRGGLHN